MIGLSEKAEAVQVATLLAVIGEEACEVVSTFSDWEQEGDDAKITPVLARSVNANLVGTSCLSGIISIATHKSSGKPTISTGLPCGRSQRTAISSLSPLTRSLGTASFSAFGTHKQGSGYSERVI